MKRVDVLAVAGFDEIRFDFAELLLQAVDLIFQRGDLLGASTFFVASGAVAAVVAVARRPLFRCFDAAWACCASRKRDTPGSCAG
ncbi:MAG: hypothetical protein R2856_24630 [Caldilineaceae bacterium]